MKFQINIEKKSALSIIATIILVGAFVSVFAYNAGNDADSNPSVFGHTANEIMVTGLSEDNPSEEMSLIAYIDSRTSSSDSTTQCETTPAFSSGKAEKKIAGIDLTVNNNVRYNACKSTSGCEIRQELYNSDSNTYYAVRTYSYKQVDATGGWTTDRIGRTEGQRNGVNGDNTRTHMIVLTDYDGTGDTSYLAIVDDRPDNSTSFPFSEKSKTMITAQDSTVSYGMKIFLCYPGAT